MEGEVINDCHAEVLARRCLLDYLYGQIEVFKEDAGSIFEMNYFTDRLSIKRDVQFHLYISTAPCGHARIFNPPKKSFEIYHERNSLLAVLRTKIEAGGGTLSVF